MTLNESVIKRLVFIRYMFDKAVEQSKKSYPDSQMSVLTFHDSVELFLVLVSEYLDVGSKNHGFMDYWNIIEQSKNVKLSNKKSMEKLNKNRNSLKHGAIPTHESLFEEFRVNVKNFFDENTRTVFNIEFFELSLIYLVKNESAKTSLNEAYRLLEDETKTIDSLLKTVEAFDIIIDDYENSKIGPFGDSPFDFSSPMSSMSMFSLKKYFEPSSKLSEFVDKTTKTIESMGNALKIISLGIDYKKYSKFRSLTPLRVKIENGPSKYYFSQNQDVNSLKIDDVNFCIDFVIETALTIQEFEFDN